MKLIFIGARHKPFSTTGPVSGTKYPVTPGEAFEVEDADGAAMIEARPERWQRAEEERPAARSRAFRPAAEETDGE